MLRDHGMTRVASSTYSSWAAILFAAQAVFSIAHRIAGGHYFGYTAAASTAIDFVVAVVWLTSACVALLRRPINGPTILLAGAATSAMYGVLFTIASSNRGPGLAGVPFLALGALLFWCTAKAVPAFREQAASLASGEARSPWPRLGRLVTRHARS